MKKKILAYALSALTCGLFTSCSDWLDINHDPNMPMLLKWLL